MGKPLEKVVGRANDLFRSIVLHFFVSNVGYTFRLLNGCFMSSFSSSADLLKVFDIAGDIRLFGTIDACAMPAV